MSSRALGVALSIAALTSTVAAQTNPLWHEQKIKNFLPHMTSPEVRDLLTRTDMVLIPVPSIEQHGPQTPTGTDLYAGVEEAKLIAQRTDVLVAPILFPGQSPYHMEIPARSRCRPKRCSGSISRRRRASFITDSGVSCFSTVIRAIST